MQQFKSVLLGFMVVLGLLAGTAVLTPSAVSAHTLSPERQLVSVRGDSLSVTQTRRSCVYSVHFTLTRQMQRFRHFQVSGPGRTHPVLISIRRYDAVAVYSYEQVGRFCAPDRLHWARQFTMIGY